MCFTNNILKSDKVMYIMPAECIKLTKEGENSSKIESETHKHIYKT